MTAGTGQTGTPAGAPTTNGTAAAGTETGRLALPVRTTADLPDIAAERYGDRPAFRFRSGDGWRDESFVELAGAVRALAAGFVELGMALGERVCILAETRPAWSRASLAVLEVGGVVVPIYASSSAEECAWVLSDSGASLLVCENAGQLAKIDRIRDQAPALATIVMIDDDVPGRPTLAELADRGRAALAAGDAAARELTARRAMIDPDGACLVIYTSGTTGPPKGCVLTHTNWLALCRQAEELEYLHDDDVVYLFLPLAHAFAQIIQFACLYSGSTLVYYGGDVTRVVAELAEARPTFLPSVPRIFEKVYSTVSGRLDPQQLAGAVQLGLRVRALQAQGAPVPPELQAAFEQADVLFAKVRAVFGGRLRFALSGAAPISPKVLEFFHAAGVPVLEGYGMTETTAVGTVNTLDNYRIGRVGVAAPGVEVRIASDGEVLMRGPHVFAGYWRNPRATAEAVEDGWIHTGDLGELDEDGFLAITGRKKDIIITAGGKNIAPANLENELRQSRWISHAVMYGDAKPYPVALITLDPEEIVPWATERGLPTDLSALARHPEVRALVQSVVDAVNDRYARTEQIKRFAILDRDLSQEAGELTPTLKVKRAVVHRNHAEELASLYV
jgi:long-chain acyl-CoA synthetase